VEPSRLGTEAIVPLAAKVAFLGCPSSYPEGTTRVEAIETHMSWVFLTDGFAYKLKKPVRTDGLDLATLEGRRLNCEREVSLNRRLAPDVYIGVVALLVSGDGRLDLSGGGRPADWLVRMRRLAAHDALDYRLSHGGVGVRDVRQVADRLAAFFASCVRVPVSPDAHLAHFEREIALSVSTFSDACDGRFAPALHDVARRQRRFLADRADCLADRARGGRIVEGHGDLRPEHVFIGDPPRIIDCLEFSDELRQLDPIDELSFLAMECGRLGAGWIGPWLLSAYARTTGDVPEAELCAFYQSVRASVRARLAILHLKEATVREPARWPKQAAQYLRLAAEAAARLDPDVVAAADRPSAAAPDGA
jgi:aminoglycoside phosphotransferase family enzyme